MKTPETKLSEIEQQAEAFDVESAHLAEMIQDLEHDLDQVRGKHIAKLKRQAGCVASARARLEAEVEHAPDLFKRPRTMVLHGVKVGFSLSRGAVTWDDDASVIAAIKKRLDPEQAKLLINAKETLSKSALRQLEAGDLAKIGCRIEDAGDQVVVDRVDGDVVKLLDKLIDRMVEAMVNPE
jgi:hypothetical protein